MESANGSTTTTEQLDRRRALHRAQMANWRKLHLERSRAINRASVAKRRAERPDLFQATQRRYVRRNRFKARARWLVQKRIQRGTLIRPARCSRCHVRCKPESHHPNYHRPLEVVWLCRDCHWAAHATTHAMSA